MTNERAVEILNLDLDILGQYRGESAEAYKMAIKALEQQPCEDCVSREAVRKVLSNEVFELMKLHTVNPEDNPKADAMAHGVNWSLNTLMELPPVTPQIEPCEDCISREEMLKYQQYLHGKMSNEENHKLWNFIKGLPSVTPKYTDEEIDKAQAVEQAYVDKMVELAVEETKRPKGKWVNKQFINSMDGDIRDGWECSKCQSRFFRYDIPNTEDFIPKYCPNCGAEMDGGGEDEDGKSL